MPGADVAQVARGRGHQVVVHAQPQCPAAALIPVVENHARQDSPFPNARTRTDHEPAALAIGQPLFVALPGIDDVFQLNDGQFARRNRVQWQVGAVRRRRGHHCRHRRRFDNRRRVLRAAADSAHRVRRKHFRLFFRLPVAVNVVGARLACRQMLEFRPCIFQRFSPAPDNVFGLLGPRLAGCRAVFVNHNNLRIHGCPKLRVLFPADGQVGADVIQPGDALPPCAELRRAHRQRCAGDGHQPPVSFQPPQRRIQMARAIGRIVAHYAPACGTKWRVHQNARWPNVLRQKVIQMLGVNLVRIKPKNS